MMQRSKKKEEISGIVRIEKVSFNDPLLKDKKIILCSDIHEVPGKRACQTPTKNMCTDFTCKSYFPVYIADLITHTKGKVDFYIETEIAPKDDFISILKSKLKMKEELSTLSMTHIYFSDCYKQSKRACSLTWPNLQMHYMDYRTDTREQGGLRRIGSEEIFTFISKRIYDLLSMLDGRSSMKNMETTLQMVHTLMKANVPTKPVLDQYVKMLTNSPRIQRQLNHSITPGLQKKLFDFITQQYNAIYKEYVSKPPREGSIHNINDATQIIGEYISKTTSSKSKLKSALEYALEFFSAFTTPIMDAYTLARIFRRIDGRSQDNIILYAGAEHIDNYRKFITKHFKPVFEVQTADVDTKLKSPKAFCLRTPTLSF
jgi:hypothetical protein